jgi:hypothetical protein
VQTGRFAIMAARRIKWHNQGEMRAGRALRHAAMALPQSANTAIKTTS